MSSFFFLFLMSSLIFKLNESYCSMSCTQQSEKSQGLHEESAGKLREGLQVWGGGGGGGASTRTLSSNLFDKC